MDMASTLQAVQKWPVADQLEFVQHVWDQLAETDWHPDLTVEQKAELDRRLIAYRAEPMNVLSWEQIEAHLRRPR